MTHRNISSRKTILYVQNRLLKCNQLLHVGRTIVSEMNIDFLFQVIMDQTNLIMDCERSTVFLHDQPSGELWSLVATGMEKNEIRIPADKGVAGWVFQRKKSLIINDAYNDSRFYGEIDRQSGFETRNILCIPLINRKGDCIGALQSLNKSAGDFNEYDHELLEAISHFVSVAVENAKLYEEVKAYSDQLEQTIKRIETMEKVKRQLTKFVPQSIAKLLEQNPDSSHFDKVPMDVSILFIDIQGFAKISENFDQELINDMLENHFSYYLERIYRYEGEVNETSGDGLMAIFKGDSQKNHAQRAVNAGLEIISENRRLNQAQRYPWGKVDLHLGINSGNAWIGSTKMKSLAGERWTYTASGLVTVLAARVGNLSRDTQLFIGPETYREVKNFWQCAPMGLQVLKNIKEPIAVYHVIDGNDVAPSDEQEIPASR